MAAGVYDIVIDQGADFAISMIIKTNNEAVNLVGQTGFAQLRPSPSSDTLTASFLVTATDAANGELTMRLPYTTTANIAAGKYYYDLELYNASTDAMTRLIQGVARVTQNVTR